MKKISATLYLNEDDTLALAKTIEGRWVVVNKAGKMVYGPDKYFTSAQLYLKIMDRKETYEISKKSS